MDHGGHVTMVEWLHKQELEHDYVIYQLDPDLSEWSRRCIRQSDRVLIVGDASGNGACSELERLVLPEQRPRLVLLQKSAEPTGTAAWIGIASWSAIITFGSTNLRITTAWCAF